MGKFKRHQTSPMTVCLAGEWGKYCVFLVIK